MEFSRLLLVRQKFPDRSLKDIPGEVHKQLSAAGLQSRVSPGSRIAVGVGSRGISNIAIIVRSVIDWWKAEGMQPFIFPAMGSHGAATAEGQQAVLARYGITQESMGCPIVSQLDVVSLGNTAEGIEAFMDKTAFSSDGVMLVGRVKWHTDFEGRIESGLFKMMAIGLGKFAGAQRYHTYAYKLGLENVIRSVGRQVLQSGRILGGLAILEDANHQTARLAAVRVDEMEQREQELLEQTKSWMGRIPCDLDILIVDELGKQFSGAGMDTKVINRGIYGTANVWNTAPNIERVFVRGLSDHSYGNAVGIGMADVTHDSILPKINWEATAINSLTASTLAAIRMPIHYPSDRLCLEKVWPTVGKFRKEEIAIGWVRNTLEIGLVALTENLRERIEANPALEILGPAWDWPFDERGNLPRLLPVDRFRAAAD
jgi:hypothetical protein